MTAVLFWSFFGFGGFFDFEGGEGRWGEGRLI